MRAQLMSLWMAALAAGCAADDDEGLRPCGEQGCSAECGQLRGDNCDIRDEECRERIFMAVQCVRGTKGELPPTRVISPEEYRAELNGEGGEDAGVEDSADAEAWSTGLALLGLLDPSESAESATIEDLIQNVAGYYSASARAITLVDRDQAEDSDEAEALLAHELVHALQDQQIGLYALSERTGPSIDAWNARGCLIEGEADLYEDLSISLLSGLSVDPSYWEASLAFRLKYAQGEIATAASPYSALWRLRYPVGARFVTDAWLRGGDREVQSLYWAAPQATIYWMHGYEVFLRREGQLVAPLACTSATPPDGYMLVHHASLGAFATYALAVRTAGTGGIIPIEAAWQDALEWRQDSLSVFARDSDGAVAVSWRVLFEEPAVAEDLAAKLARRFRDDATNVTAVARGGELEVLASEARSLLLDWEGTDPGACPIEE